MFFINTLVVALDCLATIEQVTIARVFNWDVHQRRMRLSPAVKDS